MNEEIRRFKKSLKHAWDGICYASCHEKNFRIEIVVAVIVILLMFFFNVKVWEAVIIILMIMWVLVAELINTVLERVVDILKPRIHPYAGLIKDLMAAVVLISSIVAIAVGVVIFYPYFMKIILSLNEFVILVAFY